jgi:Cys-tRNA(Pro)/Cys-tRNA(Cys) deacylase
LAAGLIVAAGQECGKNDRQVQVAIEEQALLQDLVYINGGQRGLQLRLAPREAARILNASIAKLTA